MKVQKKRHSRDAWLALALDVLADEGRAKIEIEYLAKKLGVTKGSFYSHFSDRRDFVASVAFYWADILTATVLDNLSQTKEKLTTLEGETVHLAKLCNKAAYTIVEFADIVRAEVEKYKGHSLASVPPRAVNSFSRITVCQICSGSILRD